jgi:hypothetical protein
VSETEETPEGEGLTTCCLLRRKILVGIIQVLDEATCGVGDSELADVLRFDLASADGKPVLAFRFCPWCGEARDPGGETRIVSIAPREGDDDDPDADDTQTDDPGF